LILQATYAAGDTYWLWGSDVVQWFEFPPVAQGSLFVPLLLLTEDHNKLLLSGNKSASFPKILPSHQQSFPVERAEISCQVLLGTESPCCINGNPKPTGKSTYFSRPSKKTNMNTAEFQFC
jgi:hypothetical protein